MKIFPGILASLLITALVGAGMFVIGGNALLNNNTAPVSNSPQTAQAQGVSAPSGQTQVQQLENLVQQYQQREKQYQAQLNTAAQRLNQANEQVQSYQQVLSALQERGVIQITNDGQILIPRSRSSTGNSFFGDDH